MTSMLGKVWLEASADLGIRVTAPFEIATESGLSFSFDVVVHEFGSKRGMLLMAQWSQEKAKAAVELGYGYSCMESGIYDRKSTIEALQDWGWSSPTREPAWLVQPLLQADAAAPRGLS